MGRLAVGLAGALIALMSVLSRAETADAEQFAQQQLVREVDRLNEIATRYERAGGWFSERDTAELVLTRLALAGGDLGLPSRSEPVGGRVVAVMAEEPPEGIKWAFWNHATRRFQVWRGVAPDGVNVIRRFERRSNGAPIVTAASSAASERLPGRSAPAPKLPESATELEAGAESNAEETAIDSSSKFASAWGVGYQVKTDIARTAELVAPRFDPPAGSRPSEEFAGLSVALHNPNPEGAGVLRYSVGDSGWLPYEGRPIPVRPGDEILAFCMTSDRGRWRDSVPVAARYVADAIALELEIEAPAQQLPADALSVSGAQRSLFPQVRIRNGTELPPALRKAGAVQVLWTIDGSDPLTSNTAFPLEFPDGIDQAATIPLAGFHYGGDKSLPIRAAARSLHRGIAVESEEVTVELEISDGES